ncbi:hypothetical protein SLEP1_g24470 [Rubroshorea leprosula]|uniref:Uncharacterized protein n=1 Tax=Rubroshorea leprosula TaxID=152421 RepID=A0AAV5JLV7_9ROSI|nr:hypothetical protein SLEP1_g24470 [Rubroshorea leprosula]
MLETSLSFLLKNQVSGLEHSPKPRNFPDLRCLLPLCPPASAVWGWVRFSAPVTSLPLSRFLPSSPDPASIAGKILVV